MGSGEIVVEKKLWGLLACLFACLVFFVLFGCPPAPCPLGREKGKISFCGFVETEEVDNRRRRREVWRVRRRSSSKS